MLGGMARPEMQRHQMGQNCFPSDQISLLGRSLQRPAEEPIRVSFEQVCVKKLGLTSLASSPYDSSVLIDGAGEMASSMAAALKTGVAAVDYCLRIWLRAYAFAGEAGRAVPMQAGRV